VGSQVAIVKGLSDDLAYSVEGNLLSVIWNTEDLSVVDVNPHSPLLEIVLDGAAIVSPTLVSDSDNVYIFSEDTYYSDVDYSNSLQVKDRQEGSDFMVVINDNHFASFPMVYGETAEVTLYDLSGNRYYSQRHSILDMTMISVDHLQLVEGVYLLTLSTGSYVTTEKVFITQ
jgi:hypothetical protein